MDFRLPPVSFFTLIVLGGVLACAEQSGPESGSPLWTLETEQIWGDTPETPLTRVYLVAAHPDGSVAIADGRPAQVLLFHPDGRKVLIGRTGAGPGEYRQPTDIGFLGDSLWVTDAGNSKGMVFDFDGNLVSTTRIIIGPRTRYDRSSGPIRPLADGSWLASWSGASITGQLNGWITHRPYFRVTTIDTVQVYSQPLSGAFMGIELGGDRRLETFHPVPSAPIFRTASDGTSHILLDRSVAESADTSFFTIFRIGVTGDTISTFRMPYLPIPMTGEWKEWWIESFASGVAEALQMPPAQAAEHIQRDVAFPAFWPPASDLRLGTDGRIWIHQTGPDTLNLRWLVLDSGGVVLGQLQPPAGFRLILPTKDEVFGEMTDEFDVETLVRAAIRRSTH